MEPASTPLDPSDSAALRGVLHFLHGVDHGAGDSGETMHALGRETEGALGNAENLELVASWLSEAAATLETNLQARTKRGDLALHVAAQENLPLLCTVLLKAGAEVDASNAREETPLQAALGQPSEDKFRALTSGGFDATIEILLQHGASPNAPCKSAIKGDSAFHQAAGACNSGTLQLFLKYGGDVHGLTEGGLTPLHCAAITGNPRAIGPLLDAGAEMEARSYLLYTAREFAARRGHLGFSTLLDAYSCLRTLDNEVAGATNSPKARL